MKRTNLSKVGGTRMFSSVIPVKTRGGCGSFRVFTRAGHGHRPEFIQSVVEGPV